MGDPSLTAESSLSVLTSTDAQSLADNVLSRLQVQEALITVGSISNATAEFAGNDIRNLSGNAGSSVSLTISLNGHEATGETSDITNDGLVALVQEVENSASIHTESGSQGLLLGPAAQFEDPRVYFESTLAAGTPDAQGALLGSAAELVEKAGLTGAGNLFVAANSSFVLSTAGFRGYTHDTFGSFSITARTSSGTGSGWAWGGSEEFSKVNFKEITTRAIEVAKRSENPVGVEPGRYTVILEPEAVAELVDAIAFAPTSYMSVELADSGRSVFSKEGGGNKVGLKMTDERVRLLYDPADPMLPFSPLDPSGRVLTRTVWIERGTLKNLANDPVYALKKSQPIVLRAFKVKLEVLGPTQTVQQMIASTQRGIWVRRLGGVTVLDSRTLLATGVTRDGTFLIENGKVTKPVKNMRFSESPMIVLNKIESASATVRSGENIACPRLKVHDFEFTSLSDAI